MSYIFATQKAQSVNDKIFWRSQKVLEIAMRIASNSDGFQVPNRIDEIEVYRSGYAEPGYGIKTARRVRSDVVAVGNWNDIYRVDNLGQKIIVSDLPTRIFNIFARMNIECEWIDEWSSCYDCTKLIRTEPNGPQWKPSFKILKDGELVCLDCVDFNT